MSPGPSDFERIDHALRYLESHARHQPTLDELAAELHLSSYHLQRLFQRWAGISPKRFLQSITVAHARADGRAHHRTDGRTLVRAKLRAVSR